MKVKSSGEFELAPAGSHLARCYGLIDLGTQPHAFQGDQWTQRDVRIVFELPNERMTGKFHPDSKGKPFMVGMTVKQSLHAKAKLRKMLAGWRGRDFTPEELQGFDLKNVLGKPCRLLIVHSSDGQFANIESISPLGKGEKCAKQTNESIYLSLEEDEFDPEVFKNLSDRTREKITNSPEYKALFGQHDQGEATTGDAPEGATSPVDDNIPF